MPRKEQNRKTEEPDYFSKQIHQAKRFYRIPDDRNPLSGPEFQEVAGQSLLHTENLYNFPGRNSSSNHITKCFGTG